MRDVVRRTVIAAAAVGLVLTAAAAPSAAVAAAPSTVVPAAVSAQGLPSHETWLADVAAVMDPAKAYLSTRLPDTRINAAVVFDIDNTAVQSAYVSEVWPPATPPVLEFAEQAQAAGARVFFVTHRPDILKLLTKGVLDSAGYSWTGLYMRPTFSTETAQELKTKARVKIEGLGYTIVANVGNNDTDLDGGHAERTFKLPDYDGQLG